MNLNQYLKQIIKEKLQAYMEHKIKFYPVGNGDCILIKLNNGKTIIVDCCIPKIDESNKQFDVKADLLNELNRKNGIPYVDLFISTHPHDDHCKGFEEMFYHGDPSEYSKGMNKNKIVIGELWITPRGIGNQLAGSAETIRQEAKRRRELFTITPHT